MGHIKTTKVIVKNIISPLCLNFLYLIAYYKNRKHIVRSMRTANFMELI